MGCRLVADCGWRKCSRTGHHHTPCHAQEAAAGLRYRILIEASKGPVRWFEVPSSSFTVGRAKENQVCLSGDDFLHVSRTHVKVEYRAGRLWICDMKSSKGTCIEAGSSGSGKGEAATLTQLTAGKSYSVAEGTKVSLGGCVDLTFKVLPTTHESFFCSKQHLLFFVAMGLVSSKVCARY